MDPFVDVIALVPRNFEELIEKTKDQPDPLTQETLQTVYKENLAENKESYIMIQTITVVQYYEEVQGEETGSLEPTPPIPGSIPDPTEASTKAREGRPHGGIPRGF